jgi:NTP pyrophosphatase (non-canonical NTP hydrolase)
MKKLNELQKKIIDWAKAKDLINQDNAPKQRLKLLEEVGETSRAILKNDVKEIKDGLGDIFVVLVILAEQVETNVELVFSKRENKNDIDNILFAILEYGFDDLDLFYTIELLNDACKKLDYDLTECANLAWNEIKDRTGNTINGIFLKDETKS